MSQHRGLRNYASEDLAGKYRQTHSEAAKRVPRQIVKSDLAAVEKDGFVLIEKVLTDKELSFKSEVQQ